MWGLILRDLYLNKKNFLIVVILTWVFIGYALSKKYIDLIITINGLSFMIPIVIWVIGETILAEHSNKKWELFIRSCPLSIQCIVGEKYVMDLIFIGFGILISGINIVLWKFTTDNMMSFAQIRGIIYAIIFILINSAGHKPLAYRFGENRAMIFTTIYTFVFIAGAIVLYAIKDSNNENLNELYNNLAGTIPLLVQLLMSLGIFTISYKWSVKIVSEKGFTCKYGNVEPRDYNYLR